MVRPLRPQPDTGAVIQPQPLPLRLLRRNLEPLPPPDPLDPLEIDCPASLPQQRSNPPIAIAAVLERQRDDIGRQSRLVVRRSGDLALGRAMLPERAAGKPFGNPELLPDALDAGSTAGGAYQFPEAASFRISFSSVRSDTALRRRAFSASRSFSRLTWSLFSPPYS